MFGDILMNIRRMLEFANVLGFTASFLGYQTTRVTLELNTAEKDTENTVAG